MPIVSITDYTFPNLDIEESLITAAGAELRSGNDKQVDALKSLVADADADAVITQFAPINAEVIAAMQQARVIVRYGIGVDNVDLIAARARGIPVCNVPDYCIDEVADHTLAFVPGDLIRKAGCEPVSLDELLVQSDIVTLHCPSTPQTKKMLNDDSLARPHEARFGRSEFGARRSNRLGITHRCIAIGKDLSRRARCI